MKQETKDFIRNFFGYITVAIISIAFVAFEFVNIEKSGKGVVEIIADGAVGFIFGITVNIFLRSQGLLSGKRDEGYMATKALHGEIVEKVTPKIDKLEPWCDQMNAAELKKQRTRLLSQNELRYEDYFDEDGNGKGFKIEKPTTSDKQEIKLYKEKRAAYYKALRLRLTPLSSSSLIGEAVRVNDPFYFGQSINEYQKSSTIEDAVIKVVIALAFGYFGVDPILDFSITALIWQMLQVSIYLFLGVLKMRGAFFYMVNDNRGQIVQKIKHLSNFDSITEGKSDGEIRGE